MSDHDFCRTLLTVVLRDVRKHTTPQQRRASWAYRYNTLNTVEFHGPDSFYWSGEGCCLWAAKATGWQKWLHKYHPEEETDE